MRIAIVIPDSRQYCEHLFVRLACVESVQLKIFALASTANWNISSLSYPVQIIPLTSMPFFRRFRLLRHFRFTLWRLLTEFNPDILIIYAHMLWPSGIAIFWGINHGVPIFLRNDINVQPYSRGLHKWRRRLCGKFFMSKKIFALAIGTANMEYWEREIGLSYDKIFLAPWAVANEYLERETMEWHKALEQLKADLGIAGKKIILYIGRFVECKNLPCLLKAYKILSAQRNDTALLMIGDGGEKQYLKSIVANDKLQNVIFTGYVRQKDIPRYYAMADVFVLPSLREHWGLVVNEAMASGLPVIVSDKVGAGIDLVRNGENGFVFPASDETVLAEAIEKVLLNPEPYGKRSREIIHTWSVEDEIHGFLNAINQVSNKL